MIDCQDVIKIYTDPITKMRIAALRGIDLKVNKGELISIIGPSGSGKSTLIKILAGIESISSGEVFVNEFELGKMTPSELLTYRLKTIGMVHQFPERTLFLTGTVFDNLMFASSLYSKNIAANKKRNKEILEKLGIAHLERRKVAFLSGGEMIRTAIGCMLAKNAPVLLCDEPSGQLDSENTENVKALLHEISREYNTTILVVTHDLRFLKGVDRTCEIHSGRVSALLSASDELNAQQQDFPITFVNQIDSSQSVRIPNEVYRLLQLTKNLKFSVTEDSKVELLHPDGIPPKKIEIQEKIKPKILEIKTLPDNYFAKKDVIIDLNNISKVYGTRTSPVHALSDINLEIHQGELVFVVGPSGSGKTTLIKLVTGMEPSTSGEIKVLSKNLQTLTDADRSRFRRKNIGIVSQQGDLHPYITVRDNLFVKDILNGKNINLNNYPLTEVDDLFNNFKINHRMDSYPLEISGGELQRASIAIAEFGNPGLLILDEPTANMDAELAATVMNQLYSIQNQLGITMIISTHDINLVKEGIRVVQLLDGRIDKDGIAYPKELN